MMKRFKVLFGQRRFQVLITIAALLLAAGVIIASGANFTAQATATVSLTAGDLAITASPAGNVVSLDPHYNLMRPGDVAEGDVTISNTGNVPGELYLSQVAGGSDPLHMGDKLTLHITGGGFDQTTTLSTGFSDVDTGVKLAANTGSQTFHFTVTWTNEDPGNHSFPDPDNIYMGTSCSYDFAWVAVANSDIN
jgi:spore coat-associated protein N